MISMQKSVCHTEWQTDFGSVYRMGSAVSTGGWPLVKLLNSGTRLSGRWFYQVVRSQWP